MPKRQVRSPSCPDKPNLKRNRRKSMEDMATSEGSEIEESISLKIIMDKLNAMEARGQLHPGAFTNGRTKVRVQTTNWWREKSLENAWAAIEDVQQESKTYKDSKRSHQEMLDKQTNLIQQLQAEVRNVRYENNKLRPSLKETQEKLIDLENYTRKENLRFMNIPERQGENCCWSEYSIWLVPGLQPSQGKCMCIYVGYIYVCVLCPFIYFFSYTI